MPGITPPAASLPPVVDPQRNRLLHANGQSYRANEWNLNGLRNVEPVTGIAMSVSPVESIQAMNVRAANYPAELGRSGGAITSVVRAPGTNALDNKRERYGPSPSTGSSFMRAAVEQRF